MLVGTISENEEIPEIINTFIEKEMKVALKEFSKTLPHSGFLKAIAKSKRDSNHVREVIKKMSFLLYNKVNEVVEVDGPKEDVTGDTISENPTAYNKLIDILKNNLSNEDKKLLLYAALYHDIGKSIIKPRHGPEGADVIKDSGRKEREQFLKLGFERYDFYFMSDLIRFHDYLGMLGTGETSYMIFAEVLDPLSNISLYSNEYSEKFIDFLLLLNLADIAASVGKVGGEDFTILMHDFDRIKEIYGNMKMQGPIQHREKINMVSELQKLSENHTHERLRRLMRSGFKKFLTVEGKNKSLIDYINWINYNSKSQNTAKTFFMPSWF
jgi:hypothetical protein